MSSENTANLLMDIGKTLLAFSMLGYTFAFIMTDINARRYEDMANLTHKYNREITECNNEINELKNYNEEFSKSICDNYNKGHDEGYKEGYLKGYAAGLFENKSECKMQDNESLSVGDTTESYCDSKLIHNNNEI